MQEQIFDMVLNTSQLVFINEPQIVNPSEAVVKACNFIKKVLNTHVFSCEICEIFKNRGGFRGWRRGSHFEELQTALFKVELISNNARLT